MGAGKTTLIGWLTRHWEKAEWLIVKEIDLSEPDNRADLKRRLKGGFPGKRLFLVSGQTGEGLPEWTQAIVETGSAPREIMEVDYERHGVGEALLGRANLEGIVHLSVMEDPGE